MTNDDANPLIADLVSLTAKGEAYVALMKLRRSLADLGPGDRAELAVRIRELLVGLATAA